MNDQLETEIADVLTRAADDAPLPDDELLASVGRGRRHRQRRRAVATAACALVLATVATVGTVRIIEAPADEAAAPAGWSGDVPDLRRLKPPEQVWPKAVHRLPGRLPDGDPYMVAAVLGKNRYLVHPPLGLPGSLSVFDPDAGNVRTLGTLLPASGGGKTYEATVLGVTRDRVVWTIGVNPTSPKHSVQVWTGRLDGTGQATLLTTLPGDEYRRTLGMDGDAVYAHRTARSSTMPAGYYRLPVAGGTMVRVALPDSTGFDWLRQRAWVRSGYPDARRGELWNLTTGQRLPWTANRQAATVDCDPLLCVGATADNRLIVQRLDGSGFRVLPYVTRPEGGRFHIGSVAEGRFGVGYLDGGMFVWDRISGKAAAAPSRTGDQEQEHVPSAVPAENVLIAHWPNRDGTLSILDLAAIS